MNDVARRIAENVASLRERIAAAARNSQRSPDEITLVAVTKYVDAGVAAAVVAAGCTDLGESRPQELWAKAAALAASDSSGTAPGGMGVSPVPPEIRWHLVGHLQRNKIRRTLPLVHLIHSVDSRRLLDAINVEATGLGRSANVLLEANVSGDITKTGLQPAELEPILADAGSWPSVSIRGLMGMASLLGGTEAARRDFDRLRALRDRLAGNVPPGVALDELSMGMTGDFEAAIAAGATIVRIGGGVFEGLSP